MKNASPTWKRFSDQCEKCTPEQRKRLENSLALKEAMAADDIGKAQDIFISITQPQITIPKNVKKYRKRQKLDKEFKKAVQELKELGLWP